MAEAGRMSFPRLTKTSPTYSSLNDLVCEAVNSLSPPERLTVTDAVEKYVRLNNAGGYSGPYRVATTPYMQEPMDTLNSREFSGVVFCGPAQASKALCIDTPIATPNGWSTMGLLKKGDYVFGDDGSPVRILVASPIKLGEECYRITFDDDSTIVADGDHLWTVNDLYSENTKTVETRAIAKGFRFRGNRFRYAIPNAGPLACPDVNLPIDPYTLGLWLGDGNSYSSQITMHKDDVEVVGRIRAAGYTARVTPVVVSGANTVTVNLDMLESTTDTRRTIRHAMYELGLLQGPHKSAQFNEKRIPDVYLRAGRAQRLELLRGLMDSDGCCTASGVCAFSSSLATLADGVQALVTSLGYKARRHLHPTSYVYKGEKRSGKNSHQITFVAYAEGEPVFHLARKQARVRSSKGRRPTHSGRRFITNVEPVPSVPVRCIGVDNASHLFLAGRQMVPTHNTESLILGWLAYNVVVDPMDMIIYCPSTAAARDFAVRRVDRLHRNSPAVGSLLSPRRDEDNKRDKMYRSGTILTLSWPSVTEFAGRPIGRVAMTDFDRMDDDIEGDGNPYDLASKRTTTFESFAMTMAESSPSRPILDPTWIPKTPHEAPPTMGILGLYNRGDRRRWLWPCSNCNVYFEGTFRHLQWDDAPNIKDAADSVRMICPSCSHPHPPKLRAEMQSWATWLRDGQSITGSGRIVGRPQRSDIASFWLNGTAAGFVTWNQLVAMFLIAKRDYESTQSEDSLRKFYNNDLAEPYTPKNQETKRLPEVLMSRARDLPEREVPPEVLCLVATIDVQQNMFVVQVQGIAPGTPFDMHIVDRFDIRKSKRRDEDSDAVWVKPGSYLEDWDLITEQVLERTYPIMGSDHLRMRIKLTVCDSGGKEGVTTNAYAYYRKLRKEQMHGRFHLLKGDPRPTNPRTMIRFPDSSTRATGTKAGAQGDIPVLFLNSTSLKDTLANRLEVSEEGKGAIHYPAWLPDWFYKELCAEVRTPKGWEIGKGGRQRNEAWDLCYYALGACFSSLLDMERVRWDSPPAWLRPHENNPLVFSTKPDEVETPKKSRYNLKELGKALA